MNHFSGKKFTAAHTTATDAAKPLVALLSKQEAVKKISLGIITRTPGRSSRLRVKVMEEPACLLLKIQGNSSLQEVRVYTDDKETIRQIITKFLPT